MRKTFQYICLTALSVLMLASCKNDDTDFSAYTEAKSPIYITYNGTSVTVTGDDSGIVTTSGAHVVVNSLIADSLLLVLSGSTDDGSLLVYRQEKRPFGIQLNGVSITNPNGPAINSQNKKAVYVNCVSGTTNTLTDGTAYTTKSYDQKGTLFSEGQIILMGSGTLNVNANCKNAIASDDYVVISDNVVLNTTTSTTGSNGIKANDGMFIYGGTTTITVKSGAGRGINCDSVMTVTGGTTTITTTGDCVYDETDADYSSAACIKCDYQFTMDAGTLTLTSTGDGGKGINCDQDIVFNGGTLVATTTGDNENSKPKAIKSDTAIIVNGGSFTAKVSKSWACDNGYEDDSLTDDELAQKRITVNGSPTSSSIAKKSVVITY